MFHAAYPSRIRCVLTVVVNKKKITINMDVMQPSRFTSPKAIIVKGSSWLNLDGKCWIFRIMSVCCLEHTGSSKCIEWFVCMQSAFVNTRTRLAVAAACLVFLSAVTVSVKFLCDRHDCWTHSCEWFTFSLSFWHVWNLDFKVNNCVESQIG